MSDKEAKRIRSQVRNVTKEIMPTILSEAIAQELYRKLSGEIHTRLVKIEEDVRATLKAIDSRQKDIQDYVMRTSVASPIPEVQKEEVKS